VMGSPSTVVGLPVHLLGRLIAAAGADVTRFKREDDR
jgi:predicted house-cleaning NTP pyrophosphatase (Maf/HAM1 superfamily)